MSRTQVQLLYNRFQEGREEVNDDVRPGRPSIEAVKKMILDNLRITMREVTDDVGISFSSCQLIFNDVLDMKRAPEKIISKLLNFDQKECCMDFVHKMLTTFNDDPDLL